jgi:hypothetical protein
MGCAQLPCGSRRLRERARSQSGVVPRGPTRAPHAAHPERCSGAARRAKKDLAER